MKMYFSVISIMVALLFANNLHAAHQATLKSESKFPIGILKFGKQCEVSLNLISKVVESLKKASSNPLGALSSFANETFPECDPQGVGYLKGNTQQTLDLPGNGHYLVTFKIGKTNPQPTGCWIYPNGSRTLKTIKGAGTGGAVGWATRWLGGGKGDAGLECGGPEGTKVEEAAPVQVPAIEGPKVEVPAIEGPAVEIPSAPPPPAVITPSEERKSAPEGLREQIEQGIKLKTVTDLPPKPEGLRESLEKVVKQRRSSLTEKEEKPTEKWED